MGIDGCREAIATRMAMVMAVGARMTTILTIDRRVRRRQEAGKGYRRGCMRVEATEHDTTSITNLVSVLVRMHVVRMWGMENSRMVMLIRHMLLVL